MGQIIHTDFRPHVPENVNQVLKIIRERGIKTEDLLKRDDCDDVKIFISVGKIRNMINAARHG